MTVSIVGSDFCRLPSSNETPVYVGLVEGPTWNFRLILISFFFFPGKMLGPSF